MATEPDPAPRSQRTPDRWKGQLAEDDGPDLGLGDHPVAVGVGARRVAPRQSHAVVDIDGFGGAGDDDREGGPDPGASPARSQLTIASSGSPSRLHTRDLPGPTAGVDQGPAERLGRLVLADQDGDLGVAER